MDRVPVFLISPSIFSRLKRKLASSPDLRSFCVCVASLWAGNSTQSSGPTQGWQTATPASMGMDETLLLQAKNYALKSGGSGLITRSVRRCTNGEVRPSSTSLSRLPSLSVSRHSGLASRTVWLPQHQGRQSKLASLGLPPQTNTDTGWLGDITMLQLASHWRVSTNPSGYMELLYQPGTMWNYSDGGANWLADVLTVTFQQDLKQVMFSRVFTPLGITSSDLTWRTTFIRKPQSMVFPRREFGSGVSIDVDAMARFGYLYLRRRSGKAKRSCPQLLIDFQSQRLRWQVCLSPNPVPYPDATNHYGLCGGTMAMEPWRTCPKMHFGPWGLGDGLQSLLFLVWIWLLLGLVTAGRERLGQQL